MSQQTANLLVFPPPSATPVRKVEHSASQRDLGAILHATLIAERLLPLFCELVRPYLPVDGYEYVSPDLELRLRGGPESRYRACYQMVLESEPLGELTFIRQRPFREEELDLLERLLGFLAYPLRNALLYHQALRAAHTDALTGIGNRASFQSGLSREWRAARRHRTPLSLIAIDVDHFKRINDAFGHPCGDEVLKTVATCVKESTRGSDLVYRYGGEEFMVLLSDTGRDGAARLAERIRQRIEATPCATSQGALHVTVSLGVASLGAEESEADLLLHADQALYEAKQQGRNRVMLAGKRP